MISHIKARLFFSDNVCFIRFQSCVPLFVNTVRHSLKCNKIREYQGQLSLLRTPSPEYITVRQALVSFIVLEYFKYVNISCVTTMICQHHLQKLFEIFRSFYSPEAGSISIASTEKQKTKWLLHELYLFCERNAKFVDTVRF